MDLWMGISGCITKTDRMKSISENAAPIFCGSSMYVIYTKAQSAWVNKNL